MREKLSQERLDLISQNPTLASSVEIIQMTDELLRLRKSMDGISMEVLRYELAPLSHENK